jgi:hypothetical protein
MCSFNNEVSIKIILKNYFVLGILLLVSCSPNFKKVSENESEKIIISCDFLEDKEAFQLRYANNQNEIIGFDHYLTLFDLITPQNDTMNFKGVIDYDQILKPQEMYEVAFGQGELKTLVSIYLYESEILKGKYRLILNDRIIASKYELDSCMFIIY